MKYLRQVMYPLTLVATPATRADNIINPRKADSCESDDTYVCSPSATSSDCNSSSFANAYIKPIAVSPSKTIIDNFTERLAVDRNAMPSIQASKRSAFHVSVEQKRPSRPCSEFQKLRDRLMLALLLLPSFFLSGSQNLSPSTPTSKFDTNQATHLDSRSWKEGNEWMEYPPTSGIPSTSRKPLIISSQSSRSYFKEAGPQPSKGGGPMQLTKSKRRKSRKWTPEEDDAVRQLVESTCSWHCLEKRDRGECARVFYFISFFWCWTHWFGYGGGGGERKSKRAQVWAY